MNEREEEENGEDDTIIGRLRYVETCIQEMNDLLDEASRKLLQYKQHSTSVGSTTTKASLTLLDDILSPILIAGDLRTKAYQLVHSFHRSVDHGGNTIQQQLQLISLRLPLFWGHSSMLKADLLIKSSDGVRDQSKVDIPTTSQRFSTIEKSLGQAIDCHQQTLSLITEWKRDRKEPTRRYLSNSSEFEEEDDNTEKSDTESCNPVSLLIESLDEAVIHFELARALSLKAHNKVEWGEFSGSQSKDSQSGNRLSTIYCDSFELCCQAVEAFRLALDQRPEYVECLRQIGLVQFFQSSLVKQINNPKKLSESQTTEQLMEKAGSSLYQAFRVSGGETSCRKSFEQYLETTGVNFLQNAKKSSGQQKLISLGKAHDVLQQVVSLKRSLEKSDGDVYRAISEVLALISESSESPETRVFFKAQSEEQLSISKWITTDKFKCQEGLLKFGFLMKQGRLISSWKRRFFVLTKSTLSYFPKAGSKALGVIKLKDISFVGPEEEDEKELSRFSVVTHSRTFHLIADDEQILALWVEALESAVTAVM